MVKTHKKDKEKAFDASLFDDVDIFADLTDTLKPKQKSKIKGEIKSIFDDDTGKCHGEQWHACICSYFINICFVCLCHV